MCNFLLQILTNALQIMEVAVDSALTIVVDSVVLVREVFASCPKQVVKVTVITSLSFFFASFQL